MRVNNWMYILLLGLSGSLHAQTPNLIQPYAYDFYQKLNREVYNKNSRFHSTLKPYFIDDSLLKATVNSVLNSRRTYKSGLIKKLLDEHLLDIQKQDFSAYMDILPDFSIGQELEAKQDTWSTDLGFQAGGTIGSKFSFYTSLFTGRSMFPGYYRNYIDSNQVVPGQSFDRTFGRDAIKNWNYVNTHISYTPVKYLNISAGQGKTFIGDGYRSLILSDFSANYPYLRLTANLGKLQYMAMWASMKDPGGIQLSYDSGYRKKGAVFHYLDWNVSKRLSLGFFDALIWSQYDDLGIKRSFDWSYANPLIFFRAVEEMNGSPDNILTGFTAKYEISNGLALYSQFLIDEFKPKEFFKTNGYWANKIALQGGLKAHDLFSIKNLNFLAEYNMARPHTYSERTRSINYSNYNEALAHPYGANFAETTSILTYSPRRWQFYIQGNYAQYGLDADSVSYGKDIFKSYRSRVSNYGNKMLQGIKTDFRFAEGRISFLVNPKTNLRVQLGAIFRKEENNLGSNTTRWLTFGLKSSFRNLYYDF